MTRLNRGAFAVPGSSREYLTGSWRNERPVHQRHAAPCHTNCPAGENPQRYIARLQEGRTREAWETLVAVNPLPAVTGRVCHHPCEDGCNRRHVDEPLAIHGIERYLGDEAIRQGWPLPLPDRESSGPSVAVIGAGPAGLSAAYHLRVKGCRVTLFDQAANAGGLLRSAIPPYRLPRDVLDAEVTRILETGVDFRPHSRLGRDIHLDELQEEFDAVFLGVGCQKPREWTVDGAASVDAPVALDMLGEWLGVGKVPAAGKRVVIHGGGNTAMDIARVLNWGGAAAVHVVTASGLPDDMECPPEDRMAAFTREVAQAREEGIVIHPHHTLTRVIVQDGHVTGAEISAVRKLPDAGAHMHRIAFEGTEHVIDADMVVPAIGEVVDAAGLETILGAQTFIATDAHGGVPGHPGIFAGGDALGTRGTVSASVGDGRRSAEAIVRYLRKEADGEDVTALPIGTEHLNLNYFTESARREGAVVKASDRTPDIEFEGPLSDGVAAEEVQRCMSCGDCLACDNCWTFCPDSAVLKTQGVASDGSHYVFDYEFCKGCGLCARECPTGYISMIDEAARFDR